MRSATRFSGDLVAEPANLLAAWGRSRHASADQLLAVGWLSFHGTAPLTGQLDWRETAKRLDAGHFGSGKRKYSLDLIMARLSKGAENSISMAFVVMCAEKIRRLVRLFFITIFAWLCTWKWPGSHWMGLGNIWQLETHQSLATE